MITIYQKSLSRSPNVGRKLILVLFFFEVGMCLADGVAVFDPQMAYEVGVLLLGWVLISRVLLKDSQMMKMRGSEFGEKVNKTLLSNSSILGMRPNRYDPSLSRVVD